MSSVAFPFWSKYQLELLTYDNGTIVYKGPPDYHSGLFLGTILDHIPMTYQGHQLSFDQEIALIEDIHANKPGNVRYPLVDEGGGQICIYPDQSIFYDSLSGSGVISSFDSLHDKEDDKDGKAELILPTTDMIGLLKDAINYHKYEREDWKLWFTGNFLQTKVEILHQALSNIFEVDGQVAHKLFSEDIRFELVEGIVHVYSMNDPVLFAMGIDDFGINIKFSCKNREREAWIKRLEKDLPGCGLEYDLDWWYENRQRGIVISETTLRSEGAEDLYAKKRQWMGKKDS